MPRATFMGVPRRTVLLAGIFLTVLVSYLATSPGGEDRGAAGEGRTPTILSCEPEDVASIQVDGKSVSIRGLRSVEGWKASGPGTDRWTATALDALAAALCKLPVLDRVEAADPADPYGLAEPVVHVRVQFGEAARSLRVGDLSPAGTRTYVRVDGADDVLVVGSMLRAELDKLLFEP